MNRRYDFDWLRVFGAVLVVFAHVSMIYSPWFSAIGEVHTSKIVSEILWNLNFWLMPLFMLLAGSSAWFALQKRSNRQYLLERIRHLGLPFLILMIVAVVPQTYIMQTRLGQYSGSLGDFYLHLLDGHFNFLNLWFIAYLLIYALITLPVFRFLESISGHRWMDRLARVCQPMGGIYIFALPLVIVQLALSKIWPLPQNSTLTNDWTRFTSLLLVFIFGFILISKVSFQEAIAKQWILALAVAIVTSSVMFAIAWPDSFNPYRDLSMSYSWRYAAFWTIFVLCSWSWVVTWLGFGKRFLNVNHPLLKGAAQASYPLYLFHPTFVGPIYLLVSQLPNVPAIACLPLTAIVICMTLLLTALLKLWRFTRFILGLNSETKANQTNNRVRKPILNNPNLWSTTTRRPNLE